MIRHTYRWLDKKTFCIFAKIWCAINIIQWYKKVRKCVGNNVTDQQFFNFGVPPIFHKWTICNKANNPANSNHSYTLQEILSFVICWQFWCSYFDENIGPSQYYYQAKNQRTWTDSPENVGIVQLTLVLGNGEGSYDIILVPVKSSSVIEQHGRLDWRK